MRGTGRRGIGGRLVGEFSGEPDVDGRSGRRRCGVFGGAVGGADLCVSEEESGGGGGAKEETASAESARFGPTS